VQSRIPYSVRVVGDLLRRLSVMDSDSVARWAEWVAELRVHPLDRFEYDGLIECRDRLAQQLISADDWATHVDPADALFESLTVNPDGSEERSASQRWWAARIPADSKWRQYLQG
jgi:hypothetical protein